MKREMFQELLESVQQGAEILRGEKNPSRRFEASDPEFALLIGVGGQNPAEPRTRLATSH